MSLLGRLEDLPLADILQIVFLSRRSGRLHVRTEAGDHSVAFRQGLIAGAFSPALPSLADFLTSTERSDLSPASVEAWISASLGPLLGATRGEFDFELADGDADDSLGYDPQAVLGARGFPPQKLLGGGPQVKPLARLEESLKAGKELLRAGETRTQPRMEPALPFERPAEAENEPPPPAKPKIDLDASGSGKYRFSVRKPNLSTDASQRTVLLFAPDPQLRVAVRRALSNYGMEVHQFPTFAEAADDAHALARERRFFITILDCTQPATGNDVSALLQVVRKINSRLPILVIGSPATAESDALPLQTDRELIVDLAGAAEEENSLQKTLAKIERYAEERFWQWEVEASDFATEAAARDELYDKAFRDDTERKYSLLESLILELSEPDDVLMVASTLTRAAAEYVDRGAVFAAKGVVFARILAFGAAERPPGTPASSVTISRSEPSVLREVAESQRPHHGKMRKTEANVQLLNSFGPGVPTEVIVIPIISGRDVVGMFYGDNAKYRQPIAETAGLEIFLAQAGRAFQRAMLSNRAPEGP